jgi:hypothetical protein
MGAASALLLAGCCAAQPPTPAEGLDRYLAHRARAGCENPVFAVRIEASVPRLKKQGSMSGLKLVSKTGQVAYRALRFTGDNLVKTAVIERFLTHEMDPSEQVEGAGVTLENYTFLYERTADYNGFKAYVFRLKPKRKRAGLFRGELWLDAASGAPLRLWGDLVKSPSIFIRNFRFVEDYPDPSQCGEPARLLLTVGSRIAGLVEMAVWFESAGAEAQIGNSDQDQSTQR